MVRFRDAIAVMFILGFAAVRFLPHAISTWLEFRALKRPMKAKRKDPKWNYIDDRITR